MDGETTIGNGGESESNIQSETDSGIDTDTSVGPGSNDTWRLYTPVSDSIVAQHVGDGRCL